MISVLAVREQRSIDKISSEIGVYLLAVQRIEEWCMIVAEAIMSSDYCSGVKRRKLEENKLKQRQLIKALL
mgnify:CR=1 FL=1